MNLCKPDFQFVDDFCGCCCQDYNPTGMTMAKKVDAAEKLMDPNENMHSLAPSNQHVCVNRGTPKNFTASVPKSRLNFLHEPFSPQKNMLVKTHWMKQTCTKVFPTGLLDCTVGGMTPLPRPVWMIHKKKRLKLGSFCWP